ncbi:hypothetical protein BDN71DRAFT_1510922 [Pleurotus eryngii]|uniref:RING-type domain-containing protein n=1 Tax=Pleurotus eryngii TaxID=5323 RepID=A0A9P5ZN40_PLEER|nr:hypothetical protein BDN71DRAFT_1510922 [Pleurotus eryngii]
MSIRPHPYHTYSLRSRRRHSPNADSIPQAHSRSLSRQASLSSSSSDLPQVWEAFDFGRSRLQPPQDIPSLLSASFTPGSGPSSEASPSTMRLQFPEMPHPPEDLDLLRAMQASPHTKNEVLKDLDAVQGSAAPESTFQEEIPQLESISIEEGEWPGISTLLEDSATPYTQAAQTALADLGTVIVSYEKRIALSESASQELAARLDSVTTILLDQLSCPICTDNMSQPFTCPCGHTCCAACLATWFRRELCSSLKEYICLPAGVRNRQAPRTQLEGTKLRRTLPPAISRDVFTYSCPLCRAKVIDQLQITDISKGLVTCFKTAIQPHLIGPVDEVQGNASLFAGLFPKRYPNTVDPTT